MRPTIRKIALLAVVSFSVTTGYLGCHKTAAPQAEPLRDQPGKLKAGAGESPIDWPVGHPGAGYASSRFVGSARPDDDPGSPYADLFPASRAIQSLPAAKVVVIDNRVSPTDTKHSRLVMAKIDAIGVTDILG